MPVVREKPATTRLRTPRLSEDVISFSECRNNLAACLKRTAETHRLIFITQNGRPTSFIGNVADWDDYVERMELTKDVRIAEEELDAGQGIPHSMLKRQIEAEGELMRKELREGRAPARPQPPGFCNYLKWSG